MSASFASLMLSSDSGYVDPAASENAPNLMRHGPPPGLYPQGILPNPMPGSHDYGGDFGQTTYVDAPAPGKSLFSLFDGRVSQVNVPSAVLY
jgi:hypothetical protein